MANFGFSVGDIVTVGTLAWNVYKACRNASSEFQEVAREVISLHTAVKELEEEASKPDSVVSRTGEQRQKDLRTLVQNIGQVLAQLEKLVSKYNRLATTDRRKRDVIRFSAEGLEDIRSKVMLHTSAVNLFVGSLSAASLGRIESKLDEIVKELQRGERDTSAIAVSDDEDDPGAQAQWRALRKELVEDGFQKDDVDSHKTWIKAKLRDRIANRQDKPTEDVKFKDQDVVVGECSAGAKGTELPSPAGPLSHSVDDQGLAMPVRPQARPTLVNLPPPPSGPATPDSITPKSSASSLRSVYGIKDGHREAHHSTNTLDAERADRISRLVGLVRVSTAKLPQELNLSSGLPDVAQRNIYEAQPSETYSPPPPKLRRSPSISSITSVHSDISEHDSYGNLTKRTITTTTTTFYSASATDDSAASDRDFVSSPYSPSGRKMPCCNIPTMPNDPPAPQSMMGQFTSKLSSNTQKKHQCQICDKRFTRASSLQTHIYSHTGEKPFACLVEGCGRHFSVVSNLRRHEKVHKNETQDSDADSEL